MCEGHSDKAPYEKRKRSYPLHITRPPTVNTLLRVQYMYMHMISPTTFGASLINHFILASGACSNLTICGSALHHNFGRVYLLT